jgi:hypothetical protein
MANPQLGIRLTPETRRQLRLLAASQDSTLSEVVTALVQGAIAAVVAGDGPAAPLCPGCGMPRQPSSDVMFDALSHAQCDQRLAALAQEASK